MKINWSDLVENALKTPCSRDTNGNTEHLPGTKNEDQVIELEGFEGACSRVPVVLRDFEGRRKPQHVLKTPRPTRGVGYPVGLAPKMEDAGRGCRTCDARHKPGLSGGYCGRRADLPLAYGPGHPLHQLPPDGGEGCQAWSPARWHTPHPTHGGEGEVNL